MVFTAKFQLVSVHNAEAFYKQIKSPQEHIEKLRTLHGELATNPQAYIEEVTIDKEAGKARRVVFIRGEQKRDSGLINLNEEYEHPTADGRTAKSRAVLEGDKTLIFHEKSADFEATFTLAMTGDELTVTLKSGDVVAIEKFKKV